MAQEPEVPPVRVTEMVVRMDCNGCVQRVKKTLRGVAGVSDVAVDVALNKVTVTGVASLEKIMKAMKKTKKATTVTSHTEAASNAAQPPAAPPADAPPAEAVPPEEKPPADTPSPTETKPAEATPSTEPPPAETPPPAEPVPAPEKTADPPAEKKPEAEGPQMVHHYPHHHLRRDHWPENVIYSYNRHRPVTGISEYVYLRPPVFSNMVYVDGDYRQEYGGGSYEGSSGVFYHPHQNNATSIFSDENPNACSVM